MVLRFKPSFVREFKRLPPDLREEVLEKISLFQDTHNHERLKVHKLTGKLKDFYSFSVNYSHRIIFCYENRDVVVLIAIGDHSVYK